MNGKQVPASTRTACGRAAYLLPEHVYLCLSGDQVVLLDLSRDNYLAIDAARARPLAGLVAGWPVRDSGQDDASDLFLTEEAAVMAESMSARGLLTTDHNRGKPAAPLDIALPTRSYMDGEVEAALAIRWRHLRAFAAASTTAAFKLRWVPIARIVRSVAWRRSQRASTLATFDPDVARWLVESFYRLRPFFFTAHNACLFDSLTLVNFLATFDLFPRWVFGVQTAPFAAHCWVQHADVVLNDTVEHVRRYTPIMAV